MGDTRVALAVCLAAACGGAAHDTPDPPPGLEVSWVLDDCAPWDGAATTIHLAYAKPEDVLSAPYPHVWISLYYPRSELPGRTLTWATDELNVGGAMWCVAEGECQAASRARVRIQRRAADSATLSGSLRLEFPDNTIIEGGFHAVPAEQPMVLCG
jgi:hypothetical protein